MGHFMARTAVMLSADYGGTMIGVIIGLERHFVTWTSCLLSVSTHLLNRSYDNSFCLMKIYSSITTALYLST